MRGRILGMEGDPYHEAAFLSICLLCDNCPDKCQSALESDEIPGHPAYPVDGWYQSLGDEARQRGWKIEYDDSKMMGISVLCPSCAGPISAQNEQMP